MSSKFRGKYLQAIPNGVAHLDFPASGELLPINTCFNNVGILPAKDFDFFVLCS